MYDIQRWLKQVRKCTYNLTLRRVHTSIEVRIHISWRNWEETWKHLKLQVSQWKVQHPKIQQEFSNTEIWKCKVCPVLFMPSPMHTWSPSLAQIPHGLHIYCYCDSCNCTSKCWSQTTILTLILRRSRTGTVWFYTSTSNKRAARPKLYTKSLTRDLKRMYSRFTLVRISINL